jgi:spore maturation protein CgeB
VSNFKIAFIFAHRPTDVWNTPLSIVKEFESRGWETKIYSLFDVYDNYIDNNIQRLIDENKSKEFTPDIVMYMDWGRFDSPLLDKKNIPGSFWVMESGDDPQNFERNSVKANKFHLVLTPAYNSYLEYKSKGVNAVWWTHFADSNIHKPYSGFTPFDELPKVRSTRGPGGSNLMDYLSQIMPDKFINRNGLSGMEYGDFLNSGIIVFQQSRWHEITRRLFEGMSCGKLVITDRLPIQSNIDNLFVENEDIIYYDSLGECISKINYYLSNEAKKDRERISLNGYNKVMSNHTQVQRVDDILRNYNQY